MRGKDIEILIRKEPGDITFPIVKKQVAGLSLHEKSAMLNKCYLDILLHPVSPPAGLLDQTKRIHYYWSTTIDISKRPHASSFGNARPFFSSYQAVIRPHFPLFCEIVWQDCQLVFFSPSVGKLNSFLPALEQLSTCISIHLRLELFVDSPVCDNIVFAVPVSNCQTC